MPPLLKHPNDVPTGAERAQLVQWLTARGVTGTDRASLVRAGESRRDMLARLIAWARERSHRRTQ